MSDEKQREYDDYKIGNEGIIATSQDSRRIVLAITILFSMLGIILLPQSFDREAGEKKRKADSYCACGNNEHQNVVCAIVTTQNAVAATQDSPVE